MEAPVVVPQLGIITSHISLQTESAPQFIDITDHILELVEYAGFESGLAVVASRHTTAAILVNEHEPELLKDLSRMLGELAPPNQAYAHNAVPCFPGEEPNGHAHCQALLMTSSTTIPIARGSALLGRYQRVFLVELDRPRAREVTVLLLGS